MTGKPLVYEFFDYTKKPHKEGIKHVLYRIDDKEGKLIGFDFGYDNYDGQFGTIETETQKAWVVKWAEIPNPKLLF